MCSGVTLQPVHRAEAARIVEAQHRAIFEQPLEMVVLEARRVLRHDPQVPRHAEVQNQRAAIVEMKQQVFGAAGDALDAPTLQSLRQIARHLPAQPCFVHAQHTHTFTDHVRLDAATGGFDFG